MKSGKLVILMLSLFAAGTSTASGAPATAFGPIALALAGVVAPYSNLPPAEKKVVAALFAGQANVGFAGKISVTADKIVCRISNVAITARSCQLTFSTKTLTLQGRAANELYATEVMAGVPGEGAAGSAFESLSKLNCTLDPRQIGEKDGGGANCSFEPGN